MKYLLTLAAIVATIGIYLVNDSLAYIASYQEQIARQPYEYGVVLEDDHYLIYDHEGKYIGTANVGTCDLDNLFITDNQ